jgi:hypothetical protein
MDARDDKADRHQGDTECRTGREAGFQGDDPGCHRDYAKRHQHVDRQRSGITLGECLEPLGLLRGELAFLYQPSNVENDLEWSASVPRVCSTYLTSVRAPCWEASERSPDRKEFDATAVVASRSLRDAVPTAQPGGA